MTKLTDTVQRPFQYSGGEYGIADMTKPFDVNFCMCVADSYEVGMSNLGVRILYYLLNSMEGVVCERCYTPWQDYQNYLTQQDKPLHSLETQTPLKDFDFVGFSMQYELCYSNFFHMLNLAKIPYSSSDRDETSPLIFAGGPCTVNLEPLYKFVDIVFVGEAETIFPDIINDFKNMKGKISRKDFLKHVHENYKCVYVPALTDIDYEGDRVKSLNCKTVQRNIVKDIDKMFTPSKQIVSNIELVHDRAVLELFRGCANGCRFCQAGFIYRPVRERSVENAFELCKKLIENTGYDELSLNSLSTSDYSGLSSLLEKLLPYAKQQNVQLNLPSLRLNSFKSEFALGNRKSSLTFAPEAGSQRLRDVINKNITDDDIFNAVIDAFSVGYSSVKLYFMLGLPTETQADLEGIVDIATKIKWLFKQHKTSNKPLRISVSCSTFIPKPFTPFERQPFDSRQNINAKQKYLFDNLKPKGIQFSYTDYDVSLLEAILARGGRSLADSLLDAYKNGARFDAWSEHFNYEFYQKAFEKHNIDIDTITGEKPNDEILPWDFVDIGVDRNYLKEECKKALSAQTTPSCLTQCNNCGLIDMCKKVTPC